MTIEEQPILVENTPRPFREIPGLWLQLSQMTESFFTKELAHVSVPNTLYGVLILTVGTTIISVVLAVLRAVIESFTNLQQTNMAQFPGLRVLFVCCFGLIITPISFYLNNGVTFVLALIFGGKGKFTAQAYLYSLFVIPLTFVVSLVTFFSLIPKVGWFIFGILAIGILAFDYVLRFRTLKVVHSLNTIRALAILFLPLLLVLIPICVILILMLMGPMIGNTFSSINSSLATPVP